MRLFFRHLALTTRTILFWALLIVALVLNIIRFFFADIIDYRAEIEKKIQETIQVPVHIGQLHSKMRGFSPELILQDLTIETADAQTKPVLELKEVRIGIDLLNLLWSQDAVSASWVTLVGAKIEIIRNADDSLSVKGLHDSDAPPLWLLQGLKYEITNSNVRWQDDKNQLKPVDFSDIDMVLKNNGQQHEIHILASLPEEYGNSLRVSAVFTGNFFATDGIQGLIYAEGFNIQGPALANAGLAPGLHINSGSGDIRLWSQWQKSTPYKIAGYIQAQQINISNAKDAALKLDTLEANFGWMAKQNGWRLATYDVDMTAYRQRWSNGEFYLQHNDHNVWSGLIKQLDLKALAHFGPLVFSADSWHDSWMKLNPGGQLQDVSFFVQTDLDHYALEGRFNQLRCNPMNSLPGLQGLSGKIAGNDNHGRIDFTSENMLIDAPAYFRNTLTLKHFAGGIDWRQQADSWNLSAQDFVIDNLDFQSETDFDLTLPKNQSLSPHLDLLTSFGNLADVSKLSTYYPAKVMDKDALKWLDQAFITGRIDKGEVVVHGNLNQFPFDQGNGLFEVLFSVENGELQFNPDWPHVHDVNADFHYSGDDLRVSINSGSGDNVNIKQLLVSIDSLPLSETAKISGQLQSPLQNALLFLQKTPLRNHVEQLLKLVSLESDTQVDIDLVIPYHANMPFGINVDAHVNDARLKFIPINLEFTKIDGTLHFTEKTISGNQLSAVTLGYPIRGVVSTDDIATHLQVEGTTSLEKLQQQFTFLQNDIASGVFTYQAELAIPHAVNQSQTLEIKSSLQGLSIQSQDFFTKTAEEQRPLSLNFQFDNKALLPFQIHYGSEMNAALLLNTEQNRLYSGHIVLGNHEAETLTQAGLKVEIRQPELRVSQAMNALNQEEGVSKWPALREILLETEQLTWQGRNLGAMHCHFQHENQVWQGNIENSMAKGRVSIPDQRSGDEAIKLDMNYLNLSAMNALNYTASEETIDSMPLIDIESQQLLWRSVNFGKLKLKTERLNNGVQFKDIKISGANKDIEFNADWIKLPKGSSTLINGSLKTDSFDQFLKELGYSDDFKETRADIGFTGGWSDTPQQFSLERLHGQLHIKLIGGRISSIEPGFGRLLGLLSMEQWVKRLSLDFSDIYRQGLAFNNITGNFKISNGIAYTDDLLIDAVVAKMRIAGTANLLDKTLNLRVAVLPKSSDALPIAGTIVSGIADFITDAVTDDYKEGYFFGSEFLVTGHLGDIEVTPVKDQNGLLNKTWHGLTDFNWLK